MTSTNGNERKDGGERAADEVSDTMDHEDSDFHVLYIILYSCEAIQDQLTTSFYDRLNQLEMDCIDLSQPIGDIISLERQLNRLSEVESNYINKWKENENN